MAGMVAKTAIKHNGTRIAEGEKVNKKDFTDDEWAELEAAGSVGKAGEEEESNEPQSPMTPSEETNTK